MNFKVLQFPGQGSTRVIRVRALPPAWAEPYGAWNDVGFLGSWLADDSDPEGTSGRINWGAVSGLALSLAISAGFWSGVVVLVERLVR